MLSWKTIDKLDAKVPGADTYRGEMVEFDVRFGRPSSPLRLNIGDEDKERFRIENKQYDIAVEADTLHECKQLLRKKLASTENFAGTWTLWMHVDVDGGESDSDRWGEERASCSISVKYYIELASGSAKNARKRHMSLRGKLPRPFTGEFPIPTTHKELSDLKQGSVCSEFSDRRYTNHDPLFEATPELVETIRILQQRLGESGERAKAALSKKRILTTLEAVRSGGRLLTAGDADDTDSERTDSGAKQGARKRSR